MRESGGNSLLECLFGNYGRTPSDQRWPRAGHRVGVLVGVLVWQGCTQPTGMNDREGPPRSRDALITSTDCQLAATICADLDSAITILQHSDNSYCEDLGETARNRFDATGYGYRPGELGEGDPANGVAYVELAYTGGGPYGWEPRDDNVYVVEETLNEMGYDYSVMVDLAAHEELHESGLPPDHVPPPPPLPCLL